MARAGGRERERIASSDCPLLFLVFSLCAGLAPRKTTAPPPTHRRCCPSGRPPGDHGVDLDARAGAGHDIGGRVRVERRRCAEGLVCCSVSRVPRPHSSLPAASQVEAVSRWWGRWRGHSGGGGARRGGRRALTSHATARGLTLFSSPPPLSPPCRRYRLGRKIGSGSFGDIYLGTWSLWRRCARAGFALRVPSAAAVVFVFFARRDVFFVWAACSSPPSNAVPATCHVPVYTQTVRVWGWRGEGAREARERA